MEKGYVPENKAHHKPKSGSSARKKDAKKKAPASEQERSRNPKVRFLDSLSALPVLQDPVLHSIRAIESLELVFYVFAPGAFV